MNTYDSFICPMKIIDAWIMYNIDVKITTMNYSISAFFPAYNEEGSVEKTIKEAVIVLSSITDNYEIIIIDDGSTDNTLKIVTTLVAGNDKIKVVSHVKNRGYGESIKSGIESAKLDYIFYSDADLQFDLGEIRLLFNHIDTHDAVIGYRKNRNDSIIRLINSRLWNGLNNILLGINFRDIDCAFKLFKARNIKALTLGSSGAMISSEILYRLSHNNNSIKEVPVTHYPRLKGKATGANILVIARAFVELYKFYFLKNVR